MNKKTFELEIGSDSNNLITLEEFVNYVATEINFDPNRLPGLMIAMTEAVTNAIIHANKKNPEKTVKITFELDGRILTIIVKDQGEGFDPNTIPDPTEPENLLKDSGRGLYLMRIFANELKYNCTPEGTETILIVDLDNPKN